MCKCFSKKIVLINDLPICKIWYSRQQHIRFDSVILVRHCSSQLWKQTGSPVVQLSGGGTVFAEHRRLPPAMIGFLFGLRTCSWAHRCLLGAGGRRHPASPAVTSSSMVSVSVSTDPTGAYHGSDDPSDTRSSSMFAPPQKSDILVEFYPSKHCWHC